MDYVPPGKPLYSFDFETGDGGWKRGAVSAETTPQGSGNAFKAEFVEGDRNYAVFPSLWYEYVPGNKPEICTLGQNTFLQFDYFARDLGKNEVKVPLAAS